MADLDDLLHEHTITVSSMTRLLVNLKKVGRPSFTLPMLNSRLNSLNSTWEHCKALDLRIYHTAAKDQRTTLPYFANEEHLEAEQIYWEVNDYISQAISVRTTSSNANTSTAGEVSFHDRGHGVSAALPRITMPTFSGSYTDWISFRDLFDSLVIKNDGITNVQRLHYLKVSVTGEASSLLKNITITEANFTVAWNKLKDRYDKSRHVIDAHLTQLFDIAPIMNENVQDLKRLRDRTREAVSALENLDRPVDTWDDLLAFMTIRKLDSVSRREWEMRIGDKLTYPTYKEIHDFLEYRVRALEAIAPPPIQRSSKQFVAGKVETHKTKSHLSTASKCCECNGDHALYKCEQFKAKSVEQRQKIIRENNLCLNCLSPGHKPHQCSSKYTCYQCKLKHHTLLHYPDHLKKTKGDSNSLSFPAGGAIPKSRPVETSTPQQSPQSTIQHLASNVESLLAIESNVAPASVMLATAWIFVETSNGHSLKVRTLLDQGSQASFITESVAQCLRAPRTKVRAPVSGIGGTDAGTGRALVNITLKSCINNGINIPCTAIVFQKLTSYMPPRSNCLPSWGHLAGLQLADPDPCSHVPVHLILGADVYASILLEGLKRGPIGSPIAQNTLFGWILSGPTLSKQNQNVVTTLTAHIAINESSLCQELRRFWELEEIPTCSPLSEEELACEAHFAATHKRLPEGRYSVKLPFKGTAPIQIGSSNHIAEKWLAKLERKFIREPELLAPYHEFINEYITLRHMVPTTFNAPDSTPAVFLPHHPVVKDSSTTRLRVVFNASSSTSNGTSLNDHLMIGPKLQTDLPATILRWRQYQFALTADITKMYRQIVVDPADTRYQQILWRTSLDQPIVPFRLTTVTYGTAAAPYLAMRVLKQLADDEEENFPNAAALVRNNFYVDDVLFGAHDESLAHDLRLELEQLLTRGGFTLRKWMSSHVSLLSGIPVPDQETKKRRSFDSTESVKILGVGWVPETDSFCFNATMPVRSKLTKRSVLAVTAQLFDPLGWLSPVIITAKMFMQELWIASLDWDDELPPELSKKWDDYCSRVPDLNTVSIPRWSHLKVPNTTCELHGFADASTRAYAAVIYLRVSSSENEYKISLLAAKTKVAPIKTISVPRLELCAATLLARFVEYVQTSMKLTCPIYAWTDSTVVLAWLKQHPSEWPTFVANRVSTIQTQIPHVSWKHVPTSQNPADCASRGLTPTELSTHPLWWHGPSWLKDNKSNWPHAPTVPSKGSISDEVKPAQSHVISAPRPQWDYVYKKISSWGRLLRVTAYCNRFIKIFIARCRKLTIIKGTLFSGDDIRTAQLFWIKVVQTESFTPEIHAIQHECSLPRNSILRKLNPFLDEHQILRVGGRLERSPLSFDEKHPIILSKHRISTLIVKDAHLRCLHGGPQLTISLIRQHFLILGHRPFVRNIIHKCIPCVRERAKVPTQIMGDLPAARVTQTRAFLHTGLDYAGPFIVKTKKGRGPQTHKAYLALFVCMSTRAIHLELVSDYSSDAFLAAYRRFVARRGLPSDLYSDNGTTFHGADKELQASYKLVTTDQNFGNILATDKTNWHFIPPGAPHFGGLWEAGVKCTKHHLRRVLGARNLTYEELNTLITQIEACLNSRPIGPSLTDPCEFVALTPGHFLIGAPLLSVPEPSLLNLTEHRLSRWQLVQQTLESFWKTWSAEYFHSLQLRSKWNTKQPDVHIGDLVLIRNNSVPPSKWLLGRITKCHPGPDSHVRVVTVRTATSEIKRPITQICLLPIHTAEPEPPQSSDSSLFQDCDNTDTISPS